MHTNLIDTINKLPNLYRKDNSVNSITIRKSKIWDDIVNVTTFLINPSVSERLYCVLNNIHIIPICNHCLVTPNKFINIKCGYSEYCSIQCSGKSAKRTENRQATTLLRHGVKVPIQSKEIHKKLEKTMTDRYNVAHYSQSESFKKQLIDINNQKYGKDSYFQTTEFKEKTKQHNLVTYGVEFYTQSAEYKKRVIETNLQKYGTRFASQRKISYDSLTKLANKDWLIEQHHTQKKTLQQITHELGDISDTVVGKYCKLHEIEIHLYATSYAEQQLVNWIEENLANIVVRNSRQIIPPKEIDIFLPEYGLAIEFNGTYWHSPDRYDSFDDWYKYHASKIDQCNAKGILLLHLWDNHGDHPKLILDALESKQGTIPADLMLVAKTLGYIKTS